MAFMQWYSGIPNNKWEYIIAFDKEITPSERSKDEVKNKLFEETIL
jgi:hypothetical protein